jgi:Tol biopolymer transport system component
MTPPAYSPRMDPLPPLASRLAERYVMDREIGRGGMATVYLARDVRHDRMVALKVLNPELGAVLGAERFLSEIRVTANLQHPNLLPLFDSGEVDGLLYYVMPFVDGESLRARLDRERQLPIDEAVRIAVAIAGALDYAHRHGVIHRDLKPENILLHDGQPLIADFGIALAVSNAGGARITQTGLSLGTPQYMSPEQATGDRIIDSRTDIYSLGAVTYEMLAGESPHTGTTAQAVIARLMTEEPRPLSTVRKAVPLHVESAVSCALEKLPADRFATAGQFAQALNGGAVPHHTHHTPTSVARRAPSRVMLGALALASALAILFAALWVRASRVDPKLLQFVLDIPDDQRVVTANESAVALSPDGGTIAYTARSTASTTTQIFIRRLDSLVARPTALTGMAPRFAPDGRWLLYKAAGDIRKVPIAGGSPEVITALHDWQGYGVSPRGDIVFAAEGSIYRAGDNGSRVRLVSPDTAKGEVSFAGPNFLDDDTMAFWVQRSDGAPGKNVGVTTTKGGEYSLLNIPGDRSFGMLDGHMLIGTQEGTLLAYPLNLRRRQITGPPVVLLDSVVWIIAGGLQLSIAADGSLAYLRGGSRRSLALVDKHGATVAEAPEQAEYRRAALSPDGKRVAAAIARNTTGGRNVVTSDVWIWDVEAKSIARFTTDGGWNPKWTADGKRIAFLQSTSPVHARVMWAPSDGSASPEVLVDPPAALEIRAFTIVPGGRELLVVAQDTLGGSSDVYSVKLSAGDRHPTPLLNTRFNESAPAVSPDNRWLAYLSDESGRLEVYLRPFASPAGRIRLTTNGGNNPQWLGSGSRLVYGDGGRRFVVEIAQVGGKIVSIPRDTLNWEGSREAVDAQGERMLVTRDPTGWRVVVVKNWVAEARRKLRVRG